MIATVARYVVAGSGLVVPIVAGQSNRSITAVPAALPCASTGCDVTAAVS